MMDFAQIVTIIAGFSTAAALGFVGYQTLQLRKERNLTLRAWVGEHKSQFVTLRYFNQKNKSVTKSEWDKFSIIKQKQFGLSKVETGLPLKNFGKIPARAQGRHYLIISKKPSRTDISNVNFGNPFTIMPNGEQLYVFDDHIVIFHTSGGGIAYGIFDFSYISGDNNKKRRYGFLIQMTRAAYTILDSWDEESFPF